MCPVKQALGPPPARSALAGWTGVGFPVLIYQRCFLALFYILAVWRTTFPATKTLVHTFFCWIFKNEVLLLPCFFMFWEVWHLYKLFEHFACMSSVYLHLWGLIILANIYLRIDCFRLRLSDNFWALLMCRFGSFYISGIFSAIIVLNINPVPVFSLSQWLITHIIPLLVFHSTAAVFSLVLCISFFMSLSFCG